MFSLDERDSTEAFVSVGGPLIQDKLFVYALYNHRDNETDDYTGGQQYRNEIDDDPFWGVKLDWLITDRPAQECIRHQSE